MDFPGFSVWDTEISGYHLIQEQARKQHGNDEFSVEMHRVHPGMCPGLKPKDSLFWTASAFTINYGVSSKVAGLLQSLGIMRQPTFYYLYPSCCPSLQERRCTEQKQTSSVALQNCNRRRLLKSWIKLADRRPRTDILLRPLEGPVSPDTSSFIHPEIRLKRSVGTFA